MLEMIIKQLKNLENDRVKQIYINQGIKEDSFGIKKSDLRKIIKTLNRDNKLAQDLWNSETFETRFIALFLYDFQSMTRVEFLQLIQSTQSLYFIDALSASYFEIANRSTLFFESFLNDFNPILRRVSWNAMASSVRLNLLNELKYESLINSISENMLNETDIVQYAMNYCLCEMGICVDKLTDQCIQLGEKLGLYKDMKVSKGCTSAYAPDWINAARKNRKKKA